MNYKSLSTILNIIVGFLFGTTIGYFFINKHKYSGPASSKIINYVFENELGQCSKLIPKIHICPISLSMKNKSVRY